MILEEKKGGQFFIHAVCASNTGLIRENNEDNYVFDGKYMPKDHLSTDTVYSFRKPSAECTALAVLDGMGGECAGELASYVGADWLARHNGEILLSEGGLTNAIREMNRRVYDAGIEAQYRMIGSTLSALFFDNTGVWSCNLGDSPIYLYRDGELSMLAELHTEAEIFRRLGITGRKPGLTQFLGVDERDFAVEPCVGYRQIQHGDIFVICSDGLTDMVSEKQISDILSETTELSDKIKSCIKKALDAGGRDNVTVILCEVE